MILMILMMLTCCCCSGCRLRQQQLSALQELLHAEVDAVEGTPLQVRQNGEGGEQREAEGREAEGREGKVCDRSTEGKAG